ncbi:hypothetical protein LNKW23_22960 [Paralimibaculum aggregatum]|uniref:C4-dicarboxylate ABC transporter substrate-binding protein n=1 Tax=Paralimibaculum aggregatum TaxID=3036245 RepID=A0ABQ6LP90_9RHOB|nr:TAXI family TRAP transporter solute-binding subunit [Limibaculum sp. NKW23]GMG83083.1 hypothetical protein LNKW23_22960 [Limibaculum sp. NKW23]
MTTFPRAALAALALAALPLGAPAQQAPGPLGLAAGLPGTPSARLARDIASALSAAGIAVEPRAVPGAFGPLAAARRSPGVQMAIVPGDLPAFLGRRLGRADAAGFAGLGADMAQIMALGAQPVHLLVRGHARGIEDLGGARIAIGALDSPGAVTAALLLDAARVRPASLDTGPVESAVAALLAGRVDAVFLTAPAPVPLLARAIDRGDGVRLVPLAPAGGIAGHEPAELPAGTYRFAEGAVPTVAVRAALVAWLYRGPTCERLAEAATELAASLAMLGRHGDPLWQGVRPGRTTGFAPHPCGGVAPPASAAATAEAAPAAPPAAGPVPPEAGRQLFDAIGSLLGGGSDGGSE